MSLPTQISDSESVIYKIVYQHDNYYFNTFNTFVWYNKWFHTF